MLQSGLGRATGATIGFWKVRVTAKPCHRRAPRGGLNHLLLQNQSLGDQRKMRRRFLGAGAPSPSSPPPKLTLSPHPSGQREQRLGRLGAGVRAKMWVMLWQHSTNPMHMKWLTKLVLEKRQPVTRVPSQTPSSPHQLSALTGRRHSTERGGGIPGTRAANPRDPAGQGQG
jgi:hypothetical protein